MITLKEVFDDLTYGELSNIKIGKDDLGTIAEKDYPKVVSHINLGLIDLYQKFKLKTKELRLHQIEGTTKYFLRKQYMDDVSQCGANDIYIEKDSVDPFNDDIVKVLEVYDATGEEIPMDNKRAHDLRIEQGITVTPGVFTPEHDIITMTVASTPEILDIVYQAYYPKIVLNELSDPSKIKLYIPKYIQKPLMLYIIARIVSSMKVSLSEGEANPANARWYAYKLACKDITDLNLVVDEDDTDDHFENSNMP